MMRLLVVLLVAFWTLNASAGVKKSGRRNSSCATAVEQKIQQLEASATHVTELSLDPTVKRWLALRAREIEKDVREKGRMMFHKVGDTFQVAGVKARMVAPLGHGSEAEVYLVETPHGLRSAKVFYNEREMAVNVDTVKRYSGTVPMPKIEHVDPETGTFLMEYIEGIPVKEIRLHSAEIGMTKKEATQILRNFNKEKKVMTPPGQDPPIEANVVYSPKTLKFYLIDPY